MIKLWGRNTSSNVMKVIWLLEELGLAYERVDAGGSFGGTDTQYYRAMNPLGLIPALEDGDFALFESNAILRYICNAHAPGDRDLSAGAACACDGRSLDGFSADRVEPAPVDFVSKSHPHSAREARRRGARHCDQGSPPAYGRSSMRVLALHPYIIGDDITLADFAFGPHVHRWFNLAFERPELPHLQAWYQRLLARPAFKAHCAGAARLIVQSLRSSSNCSIGRCVSNSIPMPLSRWRTI